MSKKAINPFPGVEFEEHGKLEPILGFVTKPTEDNPEPMKFVGVLVGYVKAKGEKDSPWYVAIARGPQQCTYTTADDKETQRPVEDGMRVGLSHTGALRDLHKKLGHAIVLEYTGERQDLGKKGQSPMWVANILTSKKPVLKVESSSADDSDDVPFS